MTGATDEQHEQDKDARALARLGYAQELRRAMGAFSNFAISFSIISVLTGIMTTYGVALAGGGPAALGVGWPLVAAGAMLVALAMGELASAFPTAGALYHWSAMLGGAGWGWLTAMVNLAGQAAIVAGIDLGCAQALAATLRWPAWSAYPLFVAIVASHGVINAVSVRLVAWLTSFSATVHIVGVVVLVGALTTRMHHGVAWLGDTGFTTRPDGVYVLGFLNGLVLGMWTFTGYDASAHVSEETHDPARKAPWGIVSSVVVSAVAGFALAAALTLAIGDLPAVAADAQPPLAILRAAFGERVGNLAMSLAILAMWFCGLSSVTSASRTLFAFSRDGGVPGSAFVRRVSARHRTPVVAITVASLVPLALVLAIAPLSDKVFLAVISLATTGLYVSYGLPVALGAVARHRGVWRHRGPWNLRGGGVAIAWLAVAWCLFVVVVCCLPPNGAAALTLGATLAGIAVLYLAFARTRFAGPKVDLAHFENATSAEASAPALARHS